MLEHSGGIELDINVAPINAYIEEGDKTPAEEQPISATPQEAPEDLPGLLHPYDDSSVSDDEFDDDNDSIDDNKELGADEFLDIEQPTIHTTTHCCAPWWSTGTRKPNPCYVNQAKSFEWVKEMEEAEYHDLAYACTVEANLKLQLW